MNIPAEHGQSPKQRLVHVEKLSRPFQRTVFGPDYLIAVGLAVMLLALVVIGLIGGTLASDIVGGYARQVLQWVR